MGFSRLLIRNATHFANFPDHGAGMMQAQAFRRSHPEFKRCRIKSILQMHPSRVPMGEVMELSQPFNLKY